MHMAFHTEDDMSGELQTTESKTMTKPETLTPHQKTLARARLRKHYREGILSQRAIDLMEAIPGWKWEPTKPKATEEFKAELAKVNSNIEILGQYINSKTPIQVRCVVCGWEWEPQPSSLLQSKGCPKCAGNARKTTEEFKAELAKVNSDIEVLGKYKNAMTPIQVRCRVCNYKWQPIPNNLLQHISCPKCAGVARKTTESFKAELAKVNSKIEVLSEYKNSKTPIQVRCVVCGWEWQPQPSGLLSGYGCPKCAGRYRTTEEFKAELAKVNPNIEVLSEYIGTEKPIEVYCKICNNQWQSTPHRLLRSTGCPKCARKSHSEKVSRSIRCVETGEIYKSHKAAAEAVGLKSSNSISRMLHGKQKTAAGFHWEYMS